ncbi:MAG: response regulator [Alphaproteobacteria bacterium]
MPRNLGHIESDELVFVPEDTKSKNSDMQKPWNILVVDDEESVHAVTKMVLNDFIFMDRPIKIFNAYSTKAAQKIIQNENDIAIILLDVILETPHAGLDFVKFVRDKVKNDKVRIILRTGQPGEAPENEVIIQYDINDYKYKTELTEPRLIAVIAASLRSYNAFCRLEQNKIALEEEVKQRTCQLEKAKDEALKANNAKSNFLAVMSHEIRTPMNSIVGLLELLSETMLKDDQKKTLDTITETSKSFLNLVNDILDFSKIEAGHLKIEEQEFSLVEVIENIGTVIQSQVIYKAIRFSVYIDPSIPEILVGDAFRVRQIIANLAANAAKFTNVGEINIRLDLLKSAPNKVNVKFTVSDTGIGITEEAKQKIFSPFYQSEEIFSRIYGGSGLGLSICKNLAEIMGGKISFASLKNKGSIFSVEIPFKKIKPLRRKPPLAKVKILASIFGSQTAKNLCEYLAKWGANIKYINDKELLKQTLISGENDFDLLFFDMPIISISELKEISNLQTLQNKKIIVLPFCNNHSDDFNNVHFLPNNILKQSDILASFLNQEKKSEAEEQNDRTNICEDAGKVLVVDDNPVNRLVIMRQMERIGFLTECASDGVDALASIRSKKYDLVLTDCSMPNVDGFELTKRIRAYEKTNNKEEMPVVAITANASLEYKNKCIEAGMSDYLLKPFGIEDLKNIARKWLPEFKNYQCCYKFDNERDEILMEVSKNNNKNFFSNSAPLDMFRMLSVCKNDFSALPEILSLFLESCTSSYEMTISSIKAKMNKDIEFYAHKLKSGALVAGASRLSDVAYEIEKAARDSNYEGMELYSKFLQCAFLEVSYFINKYMESNK